MVGQVHLISYSNGVIFLYSKWVSKMKYVVCNSNNMRNPLPTCHVSTQARGVWGYASSEFSETNI